MYINGAYFTVQVLRKLCGDNGEMKDWEVIDFFNTIIRAR